MNKDKQLCCNGCGGDNIEWQVWADEFNTVSDFSEQNDVYCANCEEHNKSMLKKDYK